MTITANVDGINKQFNKKKNKWETKVCEMALNIYDNNINYIERSVDSIYRHFETIGHTWGFKNEKITRSMIEYTIVDLIDTILDSDDKIDCDEAGTGGIIVKLDIDSDRQQNDADEYELTILLEL